MSFSLIRFLTAGFMLLSLLAGSARAADNPESDWRFGLAINPLSYYGLREIGRSQGLISLELNALSKDRHWELALPIYSEVTRYSDNEKSRKLVQSDLQLRYYPFPVRVPLYLGPVLRYRVDDGYAEYEGYDSPMQDRRVTRLGLGLTVGLGRKLPGTTAIPGLYYWGVGITLGEFLTNRGHYVAVDRGFFDFARLEEETGDSDSFVSVAFFRWGVYF